MREDIGVFEDDRKLTLNFNLLKGYCNALLLYLDSGLSFADW